MKFCFKQMLKVSAFYLEKQKSFISKKKYFLSRCQYQNTEALITDPILSDGCDLTFRRTLIARRQLDWV